MSYGGEIGILGAGESGVGAARLAQAKGYLPFVSEFGAIKPAFRDELLEAGIAFEEKGHSTERLSRVEFVIKSPGIPEEAPVVQQLRAQQVPVISEIEFAARYTKATLIAITGTNGKTTTTALTYHVLQQAGLDVKVAGNIGTSFARSLLQRDADYFVLEVSSFQLDDIARFHPHISVVLNITPDHLDRYHGSMYEYVSAKLRITENQHRKDIFLYNARDYWTIQNLQNLTGDPQLIGINLESPQSRIAYWNQSTQQLRVGEANFDLESLALRGAHNYFNMTVAILIGQHLGVPEATIRKALTSFRGSPHRLEKITQVESVAFYNDSKATNVDATLQALRSFQKPIIWIAGGIDKGNDYRLLEKAVRKHVHHLVVLGEENEKLLAFFEPRVGALTQVFSMPEAVQAAFDVAPPESVVLLSPACASFDLFENYARRGDAFREAVKQLIPSRQL